MNRVNDRRPEQLRPVSFELGIAPHATGSVLISMGNTRVLCGVTIEENVPRWMKEQRVTGGWLTAEYSMLPYSTLTRKPRDIAKGKLDGRSGEIQRLIGRSMRAVIDLEKLGARTVWVDCDVLQADGGTRCASITGGYVALAAALIGAGLERTLVGKVAAVSVGVVRGMTMLDLDYSEDSTAEVDMNVVGTDAGTYIELQGTAEGLPFDRDRVTSLLDVADAGLARLFEIQGQALATVRR